MASIFDTLLSSQASDTHHQPHPPTRARPPGQPFKLTRLKLGSQTCDPPSGRPDLTRLESAVPTHRSLPDPSGRSSAFSGHPRSLEAQPVRFRTIPDETGESEPGGHPRDRPASRGVHTAAVASVPPCRADEENSSPAPGDLQNRVETPCHRSPWLTRSGR